MSDPNIDKLRQEEETRIAVRIASIPKLEERVRILETGLEQHARVILKLQGKISQEEL